MSLADMYEKIASYDNEIEEEYTQLSDTEKTAAEYDAAGRIMARGFVDELDKLAQTAPGGPKMKLPPMKITAPVPKDPMPAAGPLRSVEEGAKKKLQKIRQRRGGGQIYG